MKRYDLQIPVKKMEENGWVIDPRDINHLFMGENGQGDWVEYKEIKSLLTFLKGSVYSINSKMGNIKSLIKEALDD